MKNTPFLVLILLSILSSCDSHKKEIIIQGKILGDVPEKVEYTIPLNGICSWWFTESINPDTLGNFQISIITDDVVFIKLRTSYQNSGTLIACPGSSYDVVFDQAGRKFCATGKDSLLQAAYNDLPDPYHIQDPAREFYMDTVVQQISDTLIGRRDAELAQFNKLLSENQISQKQFDLVKTDRLCYYSAVMGTIAWIKKLMEIQGREEEFPQDFEDLWMSSFESPLFSVPEMQRSQWSNAYAENYMYLQEYLNGNFTREKLEEVSETGKMKSYRYNNAMEYLPEGYLENYLASYLYDECIQKRYEKELIELFQVFKGDFPESGFSPYIAPLVDDIIEFHAIAEGDFSKEVVFVDDYQEINSMKEVFSVLPQGKYYVDVWATWCGPCKQEFKHNKALQALLKEEDFSMLYISIDRDEYSEQWNNVIKYFDLKGFHIRANQKLGEDLRLIFDDNGSMSIPWNLIVDEKGRITKKHASRPSQLDVLRKELKEV